MIRPADANETAQAWRIAVEHDGPTALVLTRQGVPVCTDGSAVEVGAAVIRDVDQPRLVLIGTGSEVAVCLAAAATARRAGRRDTGGVDAVVGPVRGPAGGLPDDVLPPGVPTISVEAAATFGWERWADVPSASTASAPAHQVRIVSHELGINPEHVVARALELLATA